MNYQADRFSALKRNMLLSLAGAEFYRVRWSEQIMDETERTITKLLERRGNDTPDDAARRPQEKGEPAARP